MGAGPLPPVVIGQFTAGDLRAVAPAPPGSRRNRIERPRVDQARAGSRSSEGAAQARRSPRGNVMSTLSLSQSAAAGPGRMAWRAVAGALRGNALAAFPDAAFD